MIKHLKIQIVRQVVQIKDTKAFISSNWKARRWTSKTNKAHITIESCDCLLSLSDIKWLIAWCCHFFVESWRDWMSSIIQSPVSNLSCCCVKVWDRLLPAQKHRDEGKMLVRGNTKIALFCSVPSRSVFLPTLSACDVGPRPADHSRLQNGKRGARLLRTRGVWKISSTLSFWARLYIAAVNHCHLYLLWFESVVFPLRVQ